MVPKGLVADVVNAVAWELRSRRGLLQEQVENSWTARQRFRTPTPQRFRTPMLRDSELQCRNSNAAAFQNSNAAAIQN